MAALFAAAGALAAQQEAPTEPGPAAAGRPLVVLELTQSGGEVSSAQRDAVQEAILAVAREADVILCLDGRPSVQDPALQLLCGEPDRDLPRLWWKARVATTRSGEGAFLRLTLELGTGPTAPDRPAQLLILSRTPLPRAGAEAAGPDIGKEIAASLAAFPDLPDWFGALQQRPELARPWPAGPAADAAGAVDAAEAGPAADAGLPPEPAAAVQSKAKPQPRKQVEISGKQGASPRASGSSAQFLVREALVGGGFSQGVTGSLRVSTGGLGFTPGGKGRGEWSIPWRDLREVSRDAGTWDIPDPLVIADRQGRKRYIARVDAKGNYLPGDAILAAVRQRRSAPAGEPDEGAAEPR